MIKYFRWNNLYSFRDQGEISFEVNQNAPKTQAFVDHESGVRLSKIESILGPNASGKTNVLHALYFIYDFIVHSFHFQNRGFLYYSPYMMNDEGSEFEVSFLIDQTCYIYHFEVNKECVVSETLRKKDFTAGNFKTVFKRRGQEFHALNFDSRISAPISPAPRKRLNRGESFDRRTDTPISPEHQQSDYAPFSAKNIQNLFYQIARPNASVISAFSQSNLLEAQKISHFWRTHIIFPQYPHTQDMHGLAGIAERYQQEPDLFAELQNILDDLDIGEHKLSFENRSVMDPHTKKAHPLLLPVVERYNQKRDKRFRIPLANESKGVFNLFSKMFFILKSLKNGGLTAIDELESGIHPQAASRILHLFKENRNQKGQILFTTHMTPILMDLDKYQVHLVEKNKNNESELYRLDQMQGVRSGDNLFKKYMAGVYGGFPDIDY